MMRKGGKFGKKEEGGEKRSENAGKEGELREEGGGRKNAAKGKEGKKEGCNIARGKECRYNSAHGTCRGFLVRKWSISVIVQDCKM